MLDDEGLQMLTCVECGVTKCADQFHREASRATGRNRRCKTCRNAINRAHVAKDRARRQESMLRWRAENPERYAESVKAHKLRSYGLTLVQYRALVEEQQDRCAICGDPEKEGWDLAVDHCHRTGRVRGLLCRRCNVGLGLLRDRPDLLRAAASYLER
ncbi:MAG: vBYenPAB5 [Frankiales bacterium]|nr:vBYenPAB5 [Frankiales bacterium]